MHVQWSHFPVTKADPIDAVNGFVVQKSCMMLLMQMIGVSSDHGLTCLRSLLLAGMLQQVHEGTNLPLSFL